MGKKSKIVTEAEPAAEGNPEVNLSTSSDQIELHCTADPCCCGCSDINACHWAAMSFWAATACEQSSLVAFTRSSLVQLCR
jgi:hypothetical protein